MFHRQSMCNISESSSLTRQPIMIDEMIDEKGGLFQTALDFKLSLVLG